MLEARHLTKVFVRQVADKDAAGKKKIKKQKTVKESFAAVDDVSLFLEQGQILGVLGPNGAGKTTLLRMMGLLMEPAQGEVCMTMPDGTRITDPVKCKRRISYLSENTKLYPRFTVREVLKLVGELYGHGRKEIGEKTEEIVRVLRMEEFIDNRVERLSTGQKQRTSIARCLIADPDIYILDEPTLGLDVISAQAIVDFMKQEKERGKGVLYSTHYMEEAETLCDRVVVIQKGRIIADDTPASLVERAGKTNLRDAFFSMIGEEAV
ncbi:MAG: ATP-binding cassette domain-containing protein [Lachnospiraceae bacterium]|nr:ATP-binding cassette domain-containing protein [Lachnospiraceae bacterium]